MSSMNSDADLASGARAFPLVVWPIPAVGARFMTEPGIAYGPALIGYFLPGYVAIGDLGLYIAFDAAVYFM